MASGSVYELKEEETPGTPLFLFDCTLGDGSVQSLSTHAVSWSGNIYQARVLDHNAFEFQNGTNDTVGSTASLRVLLADADAVMTQVDQTVGWKGAEVVVTFLFFDLAAATAASDSIVVFRGTADPVNQATETTLRLSFVNRLNLQRSYLPAVRIQRLCPWAFPGNSAQMEEAVSGGTAGVSSPFYECGYSAGLTGGVGNLNGSVPFTTCALSRSDCQLRGMFDQDSSGNVTCRFGGIEFVPPQIMVRSYGERGRHLSPVLDNLAVYNDCVPLVYGRGWYQPPIVFARNDGNLTRMEVLLSSGIIDGVDTVVVNDVEIPAGQPNINMTGTGWYNVVSTGTRNGAFDLDFVDNAGNPLGDPYGSMAYLSVVVPNQISDGTTLPEIDVLIRGLHLATYDTTGALLSTVFTNNPAWVLLDILQRAGWEATDLNIPSFAQAAAVCDVLIPATDLNGNPMTVARFQCNLIITWRRSVGDLVRGIGNNASILLTMGDNGLLQAVMQNTIANQQPTTPPPGSNSTETLDDGWPAYEFGDTVFSGIARRSDGSSSLTVSSLSLADTPNRFTVEFQDMLNEYQQDSLSVSDLDDVLLTGQEITVTLQALGIPNFSQAARVLTRELNKAVNGNTYVQFQTSVRAAGLKPGDIISLTYAREDWTRQPFRITSIAPGVNFRTAVISAQIHDDAWYSDTPTITQPAGRRQGSAGSGLPNPLSGTVINSDGSTDFGVTELQQALSDGTVSTLLTVSFVAPSKPTGSAAAIPLVSLSALVNTTAGTLPGGVTYYYAVSGVDANGGESVLSFIVTATIPAGTNTNTVTLQGLSLSSLTASCNVYRGVTSVTLRRIATGAALSATFSDPGLAGTTTPPPDQNYDHADFYWRMETQPTLQADQFSATTVGNSTLEMPVNEYAGLVVRITTGTGAGQEQIIASNTAQLITITAPWTVVPDATSHFAVSQAGYSLGGSTTSNQITFEVPTEPGSTVQICGRSANAYNEECSYQDSPVTRWQLGLGSGDLTDSDVPPAPVYGLAATGHGGLEVSGIGFATPTNTTTITSGSLTLYYWNELNGAAASQLAAALDATSGTCAPAAGGTFNLDDVLQIDAEILLVSLAPASDGTLTIARGVLSSTASAHTNGTAIYTLSRRTYVMPFPQGFFGSPSSGTYAYGVDLADARIAGAELFMTNKIGNGPVQNACYTSMTDEGLRTLSGGQFCFQVAGVVAVQNDAAPKVTVDTARSIGEVLATVNVAPSGGDLVVAVTQNETALCQVTIPNGSTVSNAVDGFGLPVLVAGATLNIDIVSVASGTDSMPGQDLTVTVTV
ncbi:MAG: phage tail protein [Bryobacteraceae bacterium]|jgi:hypothetical protein